MKNEISVSEKLLQSKHQDNLKREDSRKLAKLSNVIMSLWEIGGILLKLPAGHSLVINKEGEIFTGKIHTEKLHSVGGRIVGKTPAEFDGDGFQEFFPTSSSVSAPQTTWKNWWDTLKVKLYKSEKGSIVADIFIEAMENYLLENNMDTSQIRYCIKTNQRAEGKFTEITIPNFPITVAFSKYGKFAYSISDGKENWAN